MAGFWEEAKYWLDILSSHGVGVKAVSEVCPRAGGLSRRRPHEIIVVVYSPPSGLHAMWCLYVIGRDSWVLGKVKVLARQTFLSRSGRVFRNRRVAPRWWFIAASPG